MRGSITLAVLEAISDAAEGFSEGLEAFLRAGYGASQGKMLRELRTVQRERRQTASAEYLKQQYQSLLFKLKRDGLVALRQSHTQHTLKLTKKGKEKLLALKKTDAVTLPVGNYSRQESNLFTIISFDIPERVRWKRNWLRSVLKRLGLVMVHKSVWMGKIKIPEEFLRDLERIGLLTHVEIFQITKTGTLRHIG